MSVAKRTLYLYNDENDRPLFRKVRIEHEDGAKDFIFEHYSNGQYTSGLGGCRKVLYGLANVLYAVKNNMPIFLVEGEKDANTLLNNTIVATTTTTSLEWTDEFTQILTAADVIILYDNDKTGLKRRELLLKHLYDKTRRLRVVDLPGIPYTEAHGGDITDWLAIEGNTIECFLELVEKTPEYEPPQKEGALRIITLNELFALELPPREILLEPFLPSQGLVLLAAQRGVGKTHVALGIAYAIASGGTFLRWHAPQPKKVLYIDGEMPLISIQERLKMIAVMNDQCPASENFKLITPDAQSQQLPDLSTEDGRAQLEIHIAKCDLVVIDNISCLFRSGNENEAESWREAQEWALNLRRRGKSILFVHHMNKNGTQRGTSKREDILDAVVILQHPDDYAANEGARFDVSFGKARHFSGESARSFQARLLHENGIYSWRLSGTAQEEELAQIAVLKKKGFTIEQIKNETGLTKAQVESRLKKVKEGGILDS